MDSGEVFAYFSRLGFKILIFGPDPSTAAGLAPALVYMFLGTPGRIGTRNVEIIYRSGFPVSGRGCYFIDFGELFAHFSKLGFKIWIF